MSGLVARPTTYKGIQMRSRLEATWAARLDDWGHRWSYEPRAFANQRGQYLPDFQLLDTKVPVFIEVKPTTELAFKVMARMQIIWDSVPDAVLMVVLADVSSWTARRDVQGGKWRLSQ